MEFKCLICHATQPKERGTRLDSGSWRCADLAGCCERAGIEYPEPVTAMVADLIDQEARNVQSVHGACPDGGTCHHGCNLSRPKSPCWRVRYCGPLSGVFPGDEWPADLPKADCEVSHDQPRH